MILTTSKIQNQELADYLSTLLRCSSQEGIPDIYTQKAQSFGRMFDETFAESLPKRVKEGYLSVEVFDGTCNLSSFLNVETFSISTHHEKVVWTAYFLDSPNSACISPFFKKENPTH